MARGEEATPKRALGGLAILGVLLSFGICVLTGVLLSLRTDPSVGVQEPMAGMTAIFGALVPQSSLGATAAESRQLAESELRRRGYVAVPSDAPVQLASLPFELDAQGFAGACGVLLAVGDASTSITRIVLPSGTELTPPDPRVGVIPVCDAAHIRLEGVGSIALHPWLFPGMTASDATHAGIPTEVALAHAEAAHLLISAGLEPTDEVVVLSGVLSALPLARRPAHGCVPFVVVGLGADSLSSAWIAGDASAGRSVTGGALCATREDALPTFSAPGPATLYLRTYRAASTPRAAGPAMGALHVVSESALDLSQVMPENAAP